MENSTENLIKENVKEVEKIFFSATKNNQKSISKNKSKELELFDKVSALYFTLFSAVIEPLPEKGSSPSRLFYCKTYFLPITNTFHAIKLLYNAGLHSQVQILLRTQLEFINALIALTSDDEFFKYFTQLCPEIPTISTMKTHKLSHTDKAIRSMIFRRYPKSSKRLWPSFSRSRQILYSDLSETTHGNFSRVILQSMTYDPKTQIIKTAIGGHPFASEFMLATIEDSSIFFEMCFKFIYESLLELGFVNTHDDWFEYLDFYRTEIEFKPYKD